MVFRISRSQRLMAVIGISCSFFLAEISVGFYTHSLALVADAFHYLNDLVGFIVALAAVRVSESDHPPKSLTFGWQRSQLLGAFFNGVLLLGLGISIFLQSIERFVSLRRVENPKMVFILGCVGFTLNILSALFLHEHDHGGHGHGHGHGHSHEDHSPHMMEIGEMDTSSGETGCRDFACRHDGHKHQCQTQRASAGRDLGMMGVMLHVMGDAANNLGVMASALVIWFAKYEGRYYADPGTSMGIGIMIILTSLPLMRSAGHILLESLPDNIDADDVKHDLHKVSPVQQHHSLALSRDQQLTEQIPGVVTVKHLSIWRLNQQKTLASAHVVVTDHALPEFLKIARTINECLHAYGIHSATLQPETLVPEYLGLKDDQDSDDLQFLPKQPLEKCQVVCTCCSR